MTKKLLFGISVLIFTAILLTQNTYSLNKSGDAEIELNQYQKVNIQPADSSQNSKISVNQNTIFESFFDHQNGIDLMRKLHGAVPGMEVINTGGIAGSGTNLLIRGYNSFHKNQNPLIIVDGIRFDGNSNSLSNMFFGGGTLTTPNRFIDIDPNNVAEVTVLTSLESASLYGSEGSNGVILIRTKTGSFNTNAEGDGDFNITFNQSIYATQISSRPDYQNEYGIGFNGNFSWAFSSWGPSFEDDNPARFGTFFRGIAEDGTIETVHPLTTRPENASAFFPATADSPVYSYEARPDPIEAYFRTGLASNTNFNISGNTGDLIINVNYSRSHEDGFTPNNSLSRDAFGIGIQYEISSRLTATNTFNLSLTEMSSPPLSAGAGSGPAAFQGSASVFADLFYTPRSLGLDLPYENPVTGASAYYRPQNDIAHPVWTAENVTTSNAADRYFGKSEFRYDAAEWLNIRYKVGYDQYTENQLYSQMPGGVRPFGLLEGYYQTVSITRTAWDQTLTLNASQNISNSFTLDYMFGGQYVTSEYRQQGVESRNMIMPGLFRHSNFTYQSSNSFFSGDDFQSIAERESAGVFGSFNLNFRNYLNMTVSARNEWDSTFSVSESSHFYPSINLAYVPSTHLDFDDGSISYLKIFGGVAESGRAPDPYSAGLPTFGRNMRGFVTDGGSVITTNNISGFTGNSCLKPEHHREFQGGLEMGLMNNRIGIGAIYYRRTISDIITTGPVDPSTGFNATFFNVGEIQNKGIELTINTKLLTGNLSWDISSNFYSSASEVIRVGEYFERLFLGDGFNIRGNFAVEGKPHMAMFGTKIRRVTEEMREDLPGLFFNAEVGTPLVGPTGNYIIDDDIGMIGDPNPDWTLSLVNKFSYKSASLSFRFDYQQGGDMFSSWISSLLARGMLPETTVNDRVGGLILPGVSAFDGSTNDIEISHEQYFFDNIGFGADELRVYDMTHIRLSNLALTYELPATVLEWTGIAIRGVSISFIADNIWFHTFNTPDGAGFDPNVNSAGAGVNSRGFEYFTGPSARRFGGNVSVRF